MSSDGVAPEGGSEARVPVAPSDVERRRRNAAILLIVLGLLGLAIAGLGLVLLQVTADRRGDYTGVEGLDGGSPAAPSPSDGATPLER